MKEIHQYATTSISFEDITLSRITDIRPVTELEMMHDSTYMSNIK